MPDAPESEIRAAMEKHAALIGHVTIVWNDTHDLVYHIFEDASGVGEVMAKALFHTLRSDAGQRDLTLAAVRVRLGASAPRFASLKSIFGSISACASARNEAIHTSWGYELLLNEATGEFKMGDIGKRPRHTNDDGKSSERFEKLREDMQIIYSELWEWQREPFPETEKSPTSPPNPS